MFILHEGTNPRQLRAFHLVLSFYHAFFLLTGSLVVSSLGVTILDLSRADRLSGAMAVSLALLTGAASTGISAVIIAGIVHCTSRSVEAQYDVADLTMSWIPEFLLQVAALELVSGALLLHTRNLPFEFTAFSTFATPLLLIALAILSIWARRKIRVSIEFNQLRVQDLESQEYEERRLLIEDSTEKDICQGRSDGKGACLQFYDRT